MHWFSRMSDPTPYSHLLTLPCDFVLALLLRALFHRTLLCRRMQVGGAGGGLCFACLLCLVEFCMLVCCQSVVLSIYHNHEDHGVRLVGARNEVGEERWVLCAIAVLGHLVGHFWRRRRISVSLYAAVES
jgi:hypothetical protein